MKSGGYLPKLRITALNLTSRPPEINPSSLGSRRQKAVARDLNNVY
jgi:hypothetical protein